MPRRRPRIRERRPASCRHTPAPTPSPARPGRRPMEERTRTRLGQRPRHPRIGAGHGAKQQRRILDGSGDRTIDHDVVTGSGHDGTRPRGDGTPRRCRNSRGCGATRRSRRRPRSAPSRMRRRGRAARRSTRRLRQVVGIPVGPNTGLNVCEPAPNSGVLVLPTRMAPAALIRSPGGRLRRAPSRRRSESRTWFGSPPC